MDNFDGMQDFNTQQTNNNQQNYSNQPAYNNSQNTGYYTQPNDQQYYNPQPRQTEYTGLGVASMVLGIVGVMMSCCCTYLGIILGILGIIFACVEKSKLGKFSGFAVAGLICSIIALLLAIIGIAVSAVFSEMFSDMTYWEEYIEYFNGYEL